MIKKIKFAAGSYLKLTPMKCQGHAPTLFCHLKWLSTQFDEE